MRREVCRLQTCPVYSAMCERTFEFGQLYFWNSKWINVIHFVLNYWIELLISDHKSNQMRFNHKEVVSICINLCTMFMLKNGFRYVILMINKYILS